MFAETHTASCWTKHPGIDYTRCCRLANADTSESLSQSAAFAEIVRHIPVVYDTLDPSSIPALLSCNRELRSYVQTAVTLVYASTPDLSARDIKGLASGHWPNLQTLHIGGPVKHETLEVLLSAKLPSVTMLDLSGSWPESWPLHHLSQGTWSQLQHLDMHNSNIDAAAIQALISGSLPNLASLDIGNNMDTMCASAMHLLAQGQWPNLTGLNVSNCRLHYINMASDATDEAATAMSALVKGD